MPAMTAIDLRRKKTEREAEFNRIYDESNKDGATPSAEQIEKMQEIFDEVKEDGVWDKRIVAAEQWSMIDQRVAQQRESPGRVTEPMAPENPLSPRNTGNGRHKYSVLKAIRQACLNAGGQYLDGLERDCDQELRKQRKDLGLPMPRGVLVPNDLPVDVYAANRWAKASGVQSPIPASYALDTAAGAGSIPLILDDTMIPLLRARMVTLAMGANVMDNMQGLFAIPRQTSAATFYWVTQGSSVTPTNQTIDQVPFSPHTGGAQTAYTRQFVEQTNQAPEAFIRADHIAIIARGYETAALNGPGSGGSPLGILQNPLIPTVSAGANGGAPTWTNVVQLESTVAESNADMGALGYITDASMRGTLKTTAKIGSTFPIFIWDAGSGNPINGYACGVTNLLPNNLVHGSGTSLHAMLYGNWNDMYYAFWSGYDMIVDPYTQAGAGSVVITILQDGDVNVRHPESFVKMPDLITTQ